MSYKESRCSICRLLSSLTTLLLIGLGGYAAWHFLGRPSFEEVKDTAGDVLNNIKDLDFDDFSDAIQNFTGFRPELWDEDPFVGDNTTNLWDGYTKGEGGLELELWNALDDTWHGEYVEAVDDWNTRCTPKVLELTSKRVEVDHECVAVPGVMKVCNGNYGESGWLGINIVSKTVPGGKLLESVAKMNEHYLLNADYVERLYTMCHEIGHGFGLPHTDENFNNKDLGNCLDYTNTPRNNLRPGDYNCNRLLGMYGSVDGTILGNQTGPGADTEKRSLRYRSEAEVYEDFADEDPGSDDADYYYDYGRSQYPNMTAEYQAAMHELYYEIAQGMTLREEEDEDEPDSSIDASTHRGKWRRLRQHPRGGDFSRRLNDGVELEVHVLYPWN